MNHNSYAKIYASRIAPDPAMDVLWMDLTEDPKGSIIKFWDGAKYMPILIGNAEDPGDDGDLQPVLTREESPVDYSPMYFNATTKRAETLAGTTTKASLVDNDAIMAKDSEDSYKPKWWTFSNIKANLKSYFDNLFVQTADVNQEIQGVKTFSSSPIVPSPTNAFDAATKEYADSIAASQDNIEQVRSQATDKVASSKLLDDELNEKFDKTSLESARSQSTTTVPTSKLLDDELTALNTEIETKVSELLATTVYISANDYQMLIDNELVDPDVEYNVYEE